VISPAPSAEMAVTRAITGAAEGHETFAAVIIGTDFYTVSPPPVLGPDVCIFAIVTPGGNLWVRPKPKQEPGVFYDERRQAFLEVVAEMQAFGDRLKAERRRREKT